MKKLIALLLGSILLISLYGCQSSLKIATTIDNSVDYFIQDDLIQIKQLPWGISSDKAKEIVGEIDENNLQSIDSQVKLMPIKQLTFNDFYLTSTIRCYYFDKTDQLYNVWYNFLFTDEVQAREKMNEVVEYLKEKVPSSFEFVYNEKSSTVLINSTTLEKFDIPMASWFDETGAQLRLTIEPEGDKFSLHIKLASNKGHSLF